ncbi:MAG: hypothetical protein K6T85_00810 [Gorillibacterium sp.]|nr:hypothetical protein [Gorillibacterium sp.]
MASDCKKHEIEREWEWVKSLGCWYFYESCGECGYYNEAPVYYLDDRTQRPV